MSELYRGDVFYVTTGAAVGNEMHAGRPAVVVSNNMNNMFSPTVEVVYFTTKPKKALSTHVPVNSLPRKSTALCEQVTTVDRSRLGGFVCHVTDEELDQITKAIMVSLAIPYSPVPDAKDTAEFAAEAVETVPEHIKKEPAYIRACAERDVYKKMYETLLKK